jgi:uncharacterized protein YdiU (UPF0061 family)
LYQLANALYPLIQDAAVGNNFEAFSTNYEKEYLKMMQKIKWSQIKKRRGCSLDSWLIELLQRVETDMTIFFRNPSDVAKVATRSAFNTKVAFTMKGFR